LIVTVSKRPSLGQHNMARFELKCHFGSS
jgi:hypothetical protein